MALIPVVGRKSLRSRLIYAALYFVLTIGAVTTVYPFLLMLSESVTSDYDQSSYDIIPRYLTSLTPLYGKYAEEKFGGNVDQINAEYGTRFIKIQDVSPPAKIDEPSVAEWNAFTASLPMKYKSVGFAGTGESYTPSRLLSVYRSWLASRFHGNIEALNRAYTEEDDSFLTIFPPFEQPGSHTWTPDGSVKTRDWVLFESTLPQTYFIVDRADPLYERWLKEESGYADVNALNQAWGTHYSDFRDVALQPYPDGNKAERADWETFVRNKIPFRDVVVAPAAGGAYRSYLARTYNNRISQYNQSYGGGSSSFATTALPDADTLPSSGAPLIDWLAFLKTVPLSDMRVDTADTRYRALLETRDHLSPAQALAASVPAAAADWQYVRNHPGQLRSYYVTRNYTLVFTFMALHGRALINTLIFCTLAVLTALIINPLCAYALSRYNLSYGGTVLLYLLATMAFPAEVNMIPNFLLLKQLGLLNTFAALVLPGAASGYSIFLLKGFFDSLPRELYEAGTIDGASEGRMFWSITLPISGPIFAYMALLAFTAAYSAFTFALVLCQDPKMWTMMVWLYEMHSSGAPDYVMLAAMTLSSLPLLLVFIFAQRTIMRGIILPSFK